jgi:flagellar motor switch protein FliN
MSEANKQGAGREASEAMDDWGSALAEQASTPAASPAPAPTQANAAASRAAGERVFPPLQQVSTAANVSPGDIDRVMDVPVQLTAELGRTRITIKNLLALSPGSVVELDGLAGEPMDVFINGYLIAQGEVVVVNEKFGIRLTDIVMPAERIQKLNR